MNMKNIKYAYFSKKDKTSVVNKNKIFKVLLLFYERKHVRKFSDLY